MKKSLSVMCIGIGLACASNVNAQQEAAAAQEKSQQIIVDAQTNNGSFEKGMRPWRGFMRYMTNPVQKVIDSTEALPAAEGDKYLQLSGVLGANPKTGLELQYRHKEKIAFAVGDQLQVSAQVRTVSTDGVGLAVIYLVHFEEGNKQPVKVQVVNPVELTKANEWVTLSKSFSFTEELASDMIEVRISLRPLGKKSEGTILEGHIDDIQLAKGAEK